jgi:NADH:ubiquinone oxidoreductase subunit 4 (subunit M)
MSLVSVILAGLFLPLFPLSAAFTAVHERVGHRAGRVILLLAWPQAGLVLVQAAGPPPDWVAPLALATAALYAFRAIALRELGQWTAYLATSLWALLWLAGPEGAFAGSAHLHALGMSAPLALLALLTGWLEARFGAAYTGLYAGLAQTLPRFAGVLVVAVLASVALPLFPPFFTMLALLLTSVPGAPAMSLVLLVTWLLWTWAGARMIQGLVVGPADPDTVEFRVADLGQGAAWAYAAALAALAAGGLLLTGELA